MSEAPERIWAYEFNRSTRVRGWWDQGDTQPDPSPGIEYVRADLAYRGVPGELKATLIGQQMRIEELEQENEDLTELVRLQGEALADKTWGKVPE